MDTYRPMPGTHLSELDTPCLLVDLDAVEHNFKVVADAYRDTTCKMRQHTKNIKSPRLAKMQIDAGGTLNGVCTAKVSEAEVMIEGGITDILIPNQVVTKDKILRLCSLAKRGDIKVCVDNQQNISDIAQIAQSLGTTVGVLIEVDTSMGRAGARDIEASVALAKIADNLPGVSFRGVMSHQHLEKFTDTEDRVLHAQKCIQSCLDVKTAIEAVGIPVEMVSSGETFSYDVAAGMPGVTEVEGGTYALMCTRYGYMKEFKIANKVLGTVVSVPRGDVAIGDVGFRALSWLSGELPELEGMPGVTVETMMDEHIVLRSDSTVLPKIGDQFILLPWYQDMMVNRWDQYIGIRDGVVEEVWDIPARGCTQ